MIVINWFLCFRFDALTELGAFMRTDFLCISVLRVASRPRLKLASCKSALNLPHDFHRPPPPPPGGYSADLSKAVVPVLVLLFVALLLVLRGDLFYVLPCVTLFLCFSVLLALWLPRLGKRELILVLFVHLFDLCLFGFVCFLFLLVSGKGCGLWLWHSSDFSLTFFFTLDCRLCLKKVRKKSKECHNHKPQPFPDPKRKRKPTNLNKHKPNKRTKSTKISSLFPKRGNRNT